MIHYLKHTEIDKAKWDLCIGQSVNSMIYAYSWYLDEASTDWDALVLDNYAAVMPLTQKRKWGIKYLYQPFFTQQLGVFSIDEIANDLLKEFITSIPRKYRYIDIQLNEQNNLLDEKIKPHPRKNYLLDIRKSHDKVLRNMPESTKRNIKKANKHELQIHNFSYSDAIAFYQNHKGGETKGIKQKDYDRLKSIFKVCHEKNRVYTRAVYSKNNELLACGVFLINKNRIVFSIGTANVLGRELRAMYMLMDTIIFQYAGYNYFIDFEGSEIPGVEKFYKNLGAELVHYYRYKKNRLSIFMKFVKTMYNFFMK